MHQAVKGFALGAVAGAVLGAAMGIDTRGQTDAAVERMTAEREQQASAQRDGALAGAR